MSKMKWSSDLFDSFTAVVNKTDVGLASVKDMLQFYKRRSQIEEDYGKALQKLAKSAQTTRRTQTFKYEGKNITVSESPSIVKSWLSVLIQTEEIGNKHCEFSKNLEERVIDPVACMIKDQEKKQKTLVTDGERITKQLNTAYAALEKAKKEYNKCMNEAEVAEHVHQESKSAIDVKAKDVLKLENKATSARDKAKEAETDYKDKLKTLNEVQVLFYQNDMPRILDALQEWERVRTHLVKQNAKKYMNVYEQQPDFYKNMITGLNEEIDLINSDTDIEFFINENKTYNTPPGPVEFIPYSTPDDLDEKVNAKSKKFRPQSTRMPGSSNNKHEAQVLEVALDELYRKETEAYGKNVELPRILTMLSAVILKDGVRTEGIFRIPAESTMVQELKQQINIGIYTPPNDVHTAAAVLKLWLRSLPEPLVATTYYDEAVKASSPTQALAVYDKLPLPNKLVIEHVMYDMLNPLSKDDVVAVTRMGTDNLSMVFAPSFLRCPHEDPLVIMSMAECEKVFVKNLMLGLIESISTGSRQRLVKNPPKSISPATTTPATAITPPTVVVEPEPVVQQPKQEPLKSEPPSPALEAPVTFETKDQPSKALPKPPPRKQTVGTTQPQAALYPASPPPAQQQSMYPQQDLAPPVVVDPHNDETVARTPDKALPPRPPPRKPTGVPLPGMQRESIYPPADQQPMQQQQPYVQQQPMQQQPMQQQPYVQQQPMQQQPMQQQPMQQQPYVQQQPMQQPYVQPEAQLYPELIQPTILAPPVVVQEQVDTYDNDSMYIL